MPLKLEDALPPIPLNTIVPCLLWYLVSSITSQLTRLILVDFPYPLFLSQFQFLISGLLSLLFIQLLQVVPDISQKFPPGSVPTGNNSAIFSKYALVKIMPLALFQFVGKFFSLKATSLIPLPMVASIKTLSPIFIITGYRLVYKIKIPLTTYLSLIPLLFGVLFIISSEAKEPSAIIDNFLNGPGSSEIKGLLFCLLSMIIFACQNIYGKQLITWSVNRNTPAALALDYSSSGTPEAQDETFNRSRAAGKKKNYVKRRTNSIRLPYSSSDLTLDEKNDPNLPYRQEVDRNSTILNNPFGTFFNNFNLQEVEKPDKLTIIFYCSAIGFLFSFFGFLVNEASSVIKNINGSVESTAISNSKIITIMVLIIIDSFSHFLQTLLAFYLLGLVSAVSYSIASMMKRIIIIFISIAFTIERSSGTSGKRFTKSKVFGLILTSIGLYCYDKWGSKGIKQ